MDVDEPFEHPDGLNVSIRLEHGPHDVWATVVVTHAENKEGSLLDAKNSANVQTRSFGSFGRNDLSVEVADLRLEVADAL